MVYECDICEAVLGPGLIACPRCGQVFDEPVPADALWDDFVPVAASEAADSPVLVDTMTVDTMTVDAPAVDAPAVPTFRASRRWLRTFAAAAALLLLGAGWLGYQKWGEATVPKPVFIPAPQPSTDLVAHPEYAANMTAFAQELRATGVGAEWPAFGSNDMLVVTPQARSAEPPVTWDADTYRRLAQGIYGHFAQTRFESGFTDTDTTACSVLVTNASGQVVAVDLMGDLK